MERPGRHTGLGKFRGAGWVRPGVGTTMHCENLLGLAAFGGVEGRKSLSAVVPCYNEVSVLPELYRRLSSACADVAPDYELVFVNDGSDDGTWPLLLAFAERDSHVVCANLSRNHGHQLALSAGLSICRGERILIIDADLQDPPELLGDMMKLMNHGRLMPFFDDP